jgi:hypothetical protein
LPGTSGTGDGLAGRGDSDSKLEPTRVAGVAKPSVALALAPVLGKVVAAICGEGVAEGAREPPP